MLLLELSIVLFFALKELHVMLFDLLLLLLEFFEVLLQIDKLCLVSCVIALQFGQLLYFAHQVVGC